ncbi:MAG: 3-hydroxyacyl-CoA dehydrogenase NAD-binding domain-containing protein [Nitratireductor sp.]|nr:3-hydroxyacyl-CoA dehydrogenase NAD-binding domain-containing protein [Nitratireductor sp.]
MHCAGKTFFAGADIREFGTAPQPPFLPELIARIEGFRIPVIAAIHGAALGGGLEMALGCHFRAALAEAKIGLPEVKLGLIPGAGGTQRLPRLAGPEAALKMILSGDPVPAKKAREMGIVDAIIYGDLPAAAIDYARSVIDDGQPIRRTAERDELLAAARDNPQAFDAAAAELLQRRRGFDAPKACAESVRNSFTMPFAEGMKRERELFMSLVQGSQSAAQRHLFFAERAALKVPGIAEGTKARPVRRAAVVGAGTMGAGIALCFAEAGIPVTLIDNDKASLERAMAIIREGVEKLAARTGRLGAWIDERLALVSLEEELSAAADADLVIEAVYENMSLKHRIFSELDRITGPEAVLATNTSTLDVNRIASATSRPQSVVGMHFFSPANVMRLLEVVRAEKTAPEVLKTAIETGRALRKLPVTVGVCYGFVGNRMLHARFGQVEALLLEGATPTQIDKVMTGFGFAMGPCAVSDLAGLDVGWRARGEAGRIALVADAICRLGRFGQKTGAGYYLYKPGSRRGEADPEIEALITQIASENGIAQRQIPDEEIFERLVYSLVNEGAAILEEGIASRASDIDLIWVNGYGWPAYEGGPMFYADRIGLPVIAARLDHHALATGNEALRPKPLLRKLAETGGKFTAAPAQP